MSQANSPSSSGFTTNPDDAVPSSREPGRDFGNHRKSLGHDVIKRAAADDAVQHGVTSSEELANRAKAVAVLRKAEEFMATQNPAPRSEHDIRRALELAAGRVGVTPEDYVAIVRRDPELVELERRVLADARRRF